MLTIGSISFIRRSFTNVQDDKPKYINKFFIRLKFVYKYKDDKPIHKEIKKKDTIRIEGKLLIIDKIEHPNIYLKQVGALSDSSYVGASLPMVYAKNMDLKNDINIKYLTEKKYVLIDFWGSWCGPCILSIPKLKTLYEKISLTINKRATEDAKYRQVELFKFSLLFCQVKNTGYKTAYE